MTNLQALAAAVQVPGIDSLSLEKGCIDAGIESTRDYLAENAKTVDLAAASVLESVVLNSVSEGGFSFGIDRELIRARIAGLRAKWGESNNATPTVRAIDAW